MTPFQPQLSQQDLAAMIDREGMPWEFRHRSWITWLTGIPSENTKWLIANAYEIRLAPRALTEFGLKPDGEPAMNPGNLPADKITEGGSWYTKINGDQDQVEYHVLMYKHQKENP